MNWHMALATKVGIGFLRTGRLLFPHDSLGCFEARLLRVEETTQALQAAQVNGARRLTGCRPDKRISQELPH